MFTPLEVSVLGLAAMAGSIHEPTAGLSDADKKEILAMATKLGTWAYAQPSETKGKLTAPVLMEALRKLVALVPELESEPA